MREEKRRIIKDKLGELGHVDLHQLPRDMFLAPPPAAAYVISLIGFCGAATPRRIINDLRLNCLPRDKLGKSMGRFRRSPRDRLARNLRTARLECELAALRAWSRWKRLAG
jgi:hypothetical protein